MKLRSFIGYYHWLLLARRRYRKEKWDFVVLDKGDYYVSCNVRSFLIKENIPNDFLSMIGVNPSKKKIKALKSIESNKDTSKYHAQVVMSTNKGYRFFNYDEGTTLHIFSTETEFTTYQRVKNEFTLFFKVPIIEISNHFSVDKIINNKPRYLWSALETSKNFYMVFDRYIKYLSTANNRITNIRRWAERYPFTSNLHFKQLIDSVIVDVKPLSDIRLVYSHGDMHFGNILYDGNDIYLTDFERAGDEAFFYDIFNIVYVEYTDWHNDEFLASYLRKDGIIMDCFSRLFHAVGLSFDERLIIRYFELFLLLRFINDIADIAFTDGMINLDSIISQKIEVYNSFKTQFEIIN